MDIKAPQELWNPQSKAGLVGIVNATVYKTKPIFLGIFNTALLQ